MTTPIRLTDCPGLIDLMLGAEQRGPRFTLDGVQCVVEQIEGNAYFEAVSPDFGVAVIYPGWYSGEHGAPAHIIVAGEAHACLRWLPIAVADKRTLIDLLPLDTIDETLCRLSV